MQQNSVSMAALIRRGIGRGFLTLRREREYTPTLLTLAGVTVVAQLLLLLWLSVQGMHQLLESRLDLRLEVQDGATNQSVQEFIIAVRDLPIVSQVEYITREQAYERERRTNPELISFLTEFDIRNPFPDTIAVRLQELKDYDAFTSFLRDEKWKTVVDPKFLTQTTAQEQEVRQMLRLTETGKLISFSFVVLTVCVLLFVLIELVRRRSLLRTEEIFIERLVGAPSLSVLLPFATEAAVLLFSALVFSILLLFGLYWGVVYMMPTLLEGPMSTLIQQTTIFLDGRLPLLLGIEFLLVPILAFGGAYLGMRPQLKRGGLVMGT